MLTLISDIHITDETTSNNVSPQAFEIYKKEIITNAKENNVEKLGFIQDSVSVYIGDNSIASTDFKLNMKRTHKNYNNLSNIQINKFYLNQNFPNPFNPSTTIRFVIPVSELNGAYIELNLYDILGKKVKTLVKEILKPGEYEVSWDASNYATGIYFYELKSNNFECVKKMMLVK
jgi:hypothetical protein